MRDRLAANDPVDQVTDRLALLGDGLLELGCG
jgi:hypothetical protein